MRFNICPNCKTYTLQERCPKCNSKTVEFRTLKYSVEDKYQKYRIEEKRKLIENGEL